MPVTRAVIALVVLLSADSVSAQYVVPATSPLASGAMPSAVRSAGPYVVENDSRRAAQSGVVVDVSLAKHIMIGAVIGGALGYIIGINTYESKPDQWFGKGYHGALGLIAGATTGAVVGLTVWGVRRTPTSESEDDAMLSPSGMPLMPAPATRVGSRPAGRG